MKKLILFITLGLSLYAHPHFFIDSKIVFEENSIKNHWQFDRLNSKLLMFDFDKNRNKILDESEKNSFLEAHFSPLEKNNYNIFLSNEDNEFKVLPRNINVEMKKNRISIVFDIDYLTNTKGTTFCTIDEKIYMAYKLIDIKSQIKLDVENSEYDYCIGVL